MEKFNIELTYAEYNELTTNREKELELILRAHGVIISILRLKSLYKCLNLFFSNGDIELTKIFNIIDKMEDLTIENVNKLRNE